MLRAIAGYILGGILNDSPDENMECEAREINDWLVVNMPNKPEENDFDLESETESVIEDEIELAIEDEIELIRGDETKSVIGNADILSCLPMLMSPEELRNDNSFVDKQERIAEISEAPLNSKEKKRKPPHSQYRKIYKQERIADISEAPLNSKEERKEPPHPQYRKIHEQEGIEEISEAPLNSKEEKEEHAFSFHGEIIKVKDISEVYVTNFLKELREHSPFCDISGTYPNREKCVLQLKRIYLIKYGYFDADEEFDYINNKAIQEHVQEHEKEVQEREKQQREINNSNLNLVFNYIQTPAAKADKPNDFDLESESVIEDEIKLVRRDETKSVIDEDDILSCLPMLMSPEELCIGNSFVDKQERIADISEAPLNSKEKRTPYSQYRKIHKQERFTDISEAPLNSKEKRKVPSHPQYRKIHKKERIAVLTEAPLNSKEKRKEPPHLQYSKIHKQERIADTSEAFINSKEKRKEPSHPQYRKIHKQERIAGISGAPLNSKEKRKDPPHPQYSKIHKQERIEEISEAPLNSKEERKEHIITLRGCIQILEWIPDSSLTRHLKELKKHSPFCDISRTYPNHEKCVLQLKRIFLIKYEHFDDDENNKAVQEHVQEHEKEIQEQEKQQREESNYNLYLVWNEIQMAAKTDFFQQIKDLQPSQKAKEIAQKKLLTRSNLNRQNKNYIFCSSAKTNRRKDLQRNHSGANNNRNMNRKC